jgi:hypothetical protein
MKNIGILIISKECLEDALPLPKEAKILGCEQSNPNGTGIIFFVESEDIPPRKEGEICPEVRLEVTRHSDKSLTGKFIT